MIIERVGCCFSADPAPKLCWMITTGCNLRCRHCAVFENDFVSGFGGIRALSDIAAVVDFVRTHNVSRVVVSGGEPLLSPWLTHVLRALRQAEVETSLSTNATLVDARTAAMLAEMGLAKATVSLDGASPRTHDALRGTGAFEKASRGLEALVGAGVSVSVGTFLRTDIAGEISDLASYCLDSGVSKLSLFRPLERGRYLRNISAFGTNLPLAALASATKDARERGLKVSVHAPECARPDCPSGVRVFGAIGGRAFDHCVYKENVTSRFLLDAA